MHRYLRSTLSLISLVIVIPVMSGTVAQEKPLTFWELMTLNNAGSPVISPDGAWVAYTLSKLDTASMETETHIWLAPVNGSEEPRQFTNGASNESSPRFTPDSRNLTFLATRGDSKRQVWSIPLTGGEAMQLTHFEDGLPGSPVWNRGMTQFAYAKRDEWEDKDEREARAKKNDDVVIVEEGRVLHTNIHVFDMESGETIQVTDDDFDNSGPVWSPDGEWLAFTSNRTDRPWYNSNSDIFIVSASGGEIRRLTDSEGSDGSPTFSPDGEWIVYSGNTSAGRSHEDSDYFIIPSGGGTPRNLTAEFDYSVGGGVTFAPDGTFFWFSAGRKTDTHLFRCEISDGTIGQGTDGIGSHSGFSFSEDVETAVWRFTGPEWPAEIMTGRIGRRDRQLTDLNPHLREYDIASQEVISWTGPDNLEIEAVLTYPIGYRRGQRYPTIFVIHGGPHGRHSNTFNARMAQMLAAKGYLVVGPNVRGSSAYGTAFGVADEGDWGGKDFQDIMAGVDHLIGTGLADGDRLGIMGGSYGGFMTYWAITQTDRFKAAIAHAGIVDWWSFWGQTDIPTYLEYGFLGLPWETKEIWERWSGMEYVTNVTTPLLITHGEEDRRVPIAQAEQFWRGMDRQGLPVVFLRYPREGHGIGEPRHRVDLYLRQMAWFDHYLKGEGERSPDDRYR
ncbi:S9 family peptidase [Gemmatimonadota bacterium]